MKSIIRSGAALRAGAVLLLAGPLVSWLAEFITAAAWQHPHYAPLYNWVSHLGLTGPSQVAFGQVGNSPLGAVMDAGWIFYGVSLIVGTLLTFDVRRGGRPIAIVVVGIIAGIGVSLVGIFQGWCRASSAPSDSSPSLSQWHAENPATKSRRYLLQRPGGRYAATLPRPNPPSPVHSVARCRLSRTPPCRDRISEADRLSTALWDEVDYGRHSADQEEASEEHPGVHRWGRPWRPQPRRTVIERTANIGRAVRWQEWAEAVGHGSLSACPAPG